MDLARIYSVSRHTVRAALGQLEASGSVSRRTGVGTRVNATCEGGQYRQSIGSIGDLVHFGERHRRSVERSAPVVLDIETAAALGCAPGSRWFWISSVRWDGRARDTVPVCWTDNYVDPRYADMESVIAQNQTDLICDLIERRYRRRAVSVVQAVEATGMPAEIAGNLGVGPGTPAMSIVRRYLDETNDVFMVTRSLHPEGLFTLHMRLDRAE